MGNQGTKEAKEKNIIAQNAACGSNDNIIVTMERFYHEFNFMRN